MGSNLWAKQRKGGITTLVFDLGGVVLTNDSVKDYGELRRRFGASQEGMDRAWGLMWPKYVVGKITERQFWTGFIRAAAGKKADSSDIAYSRAAYARHQKEIGHMLSLLSRLHRRYRLVALTNIGKEWLEFKRERFGLDRHFSFIVDSPSSGSSKPDRKIYRILLRKLKADPASCLFIDDKEVNLEVARSFGIRTLRFTGQAKLEGDLRRLDLLGGRKGR